MKGNDAGVIHIGIHTAAWVAHDAVAFRFKTLSPALLTHTEGKEIVMGHLAMVHTEVSECVQELRKNQPVDRNALAGELADIIIRTLVVGRGLGLCIEGAVVDKIEKIVKQETSKGKEL